MNRTWLLLRIQIINTLPINEIREPGNKKKNTAILMGIGMITIALLLFSYNILTAQALAQTGAQKLIPAYMAAISSFAIIILTMFRSNDILFGSRDIEMLFSLPIKFGEIISSKFLFLYLLNFIVSFIFMVPGGIIWIINTDMDISRFTLYYITIFFVPLLPMCIASFIGILITLVTSRLKNRNIISLILSFAAIGLIGYISAYSSQEGSDISILSTMLAQQITRIYPPSKLFLEHLGFSALAGMGTFILLSFMVFYLFVKITASRYLLFRTLATTSSQYVIRKGTAKAHSPFIALYRKELGRFFNSYTTVLNTGFGVIFLCIFSIFLLVVPLQQLGNYVGVVNINEFLADYAPVVIASMLSLSCPAASSISLEGRNIWILQSSPISTKMILNSKLAVTLTLHAFGYLFAVPAIILQVDMNFIQFISLLLVPICYSLFTVTLGISLNKKYPNYEWDNEVTVVKQSMPAMISSIFAMIAIGIPVLLHLLLAFPLLPTLLGTATILIIAAGIMHHKACMASYL